MKLDSGRRRRAFLRIACVFFLAATWAWGAAGPIRVRHEPAQPRSGEVVRISVNAGLEAAGEPVLEYQEVAPGRYLSPTDPDYEQKWTRRSLSPAGDGRLVAEMPAALQRNRYLIRYRIRSGRTGQVLLPDREDRQGNFAYFVYDGVPDWRGAVNPRGSGAARKPVSFPAAVLTNVAVYHFIASQPAVEEVMWKPRPHSWNDDSRHEYHHTGTLVYDGVVHDHVKFRARGGGWRHAMGKNMWKFNFNPGHRLAARDFYGRPYAGKWDKLNLGACIQQADFQMRGEQGMFEAITFRLFNLAGSEAPRTHWVHLRVVTGEEETPPDQYRGDFWGLYLAVEEIDGDFLKEHSLPDGDLYKIDGFQPHAQHYAKGGVPDDSAARQFLASVMGAGGRSRGLRLRRPDDGWLESVDLTRYYSYRSILEATHHYDVGAGKNYFFYHDRRAQRWQVVPWDVDLTWADHMYGDGNEPFFAAGILQRSPFREAYQHRLAEICDLLFNSDQMNRLIEEHASMIWNGKDQPSLADADRAKWDHHPILSSSSVMSGKTAPGLFYFRNSNNRFDVMTAHMKSYVARRMRHLDGLLVEFRPPPPPHLSGPSAVALGDRTVALEAKPADRPEPGRRYQWRLAEITETKSPVFNPREAWRYEIETLWQSPPTNSLRMNIPLEDLAAGHTYRIRVRSVPASGSASRWSAPYEFVPR